MESAARVGVSSIAWTLTRLEQTTSSWSYKSTNTNTVGASVTVRGGIGIVEAEATAKREIALQSPSRASGLESSSDSLPCTYQGITQSPRKVP